MNNIQDIAKQPLVEWGGQVVITTAQLAEVYGATTDNISDNFSRNKARFTEGKHYIFLTGNELKEFKNQSADSGVVAKNASQLYLWTRRGASRHCKILGTDKAWEQFDYLEDNYFDRGANNKQIPTTIPEQIQLLAQGYTGIKEEVDTIKADLEALKMDLPILPIEADKITEAVRKKGVAVLGGKQSNAYNNRGLRQKLYNNLYSNLKYNFGVKSYKSIKRSQCDKAIEVIQKYEPPFFLAQQIESVNAQQSLNLEGGTANE